MKQDGNGLLQVQTIWAQSTHFNTRGANWISRLQLLATELFAGGKNCQSQAERKTLYTSTICICIWNSKPPSSSSSGLEKYLNSTSPIGQPTLNFCLSAELPRLPKFSNSLIIHELKMEVVLNTSILTIWRTLCWTPWRFTYILSTI